MPRIRRAYQSDVNDPSATLAVHCGNGFDAGFSPKDAVIGIFGGKLSRTAMASSRRAMMARSLKCLNMEHLGNFEVLAAEDRSPKNSRLVYLGERFNVFS
jgi:hypothetical protein